MLCLAVIYDIESGREEEAAALFLQLKAASEREPGNLGYEVFRATDDPRRFFLYETYRDEAALEAHRNSDHFRKCGLNGVRTIARNREAVLCVPLTSS